MELKDAFRIEREEAAWRAHCLIVDWALSGQLERMCGADISFHIGNAIKSGDNRPEAIEEQKAAISSVAPAHHG